MTVRQVDWDFSKRGQEDVARHQKKIKESIRENIADVISEESIISRKKGTTVKIPIRGIKSYQFIYGKRKGGGEGGGQYGLGHGKHGKANHGLETRVQDVHVSPLSTRLRLQDTPPRA